MSSYKCSKCDYNSKTKGLVTKHIKTVKKCVGASLIEDIVKVKCEICNKEFDTDRLLANHRQICLEKKAIVVNNYVDPKAVENSIVILTSVVKNLSEKLIKIELENDQLKKRLDKLENKHKTIQPKYQECDPDQQCGFGDKITFIPVSRNQVVQIAKECKNEDDTLPMTLEGQRSNIVEGNIAEKDYKNYVAKTIMF